MPEISRHAVTAGTVANLVELVVQVVGSLGTADVTNTLGGVTVTSDQAAAMVNTELQASFRDAAASGSD